MILVDTSVWITHLRGRQSATTARLQVAVAREPVLIGDLILLEVLQGARDDLHAARIERHMRRFTIVSLLGDALAVRAAQNYRILRNLGIIVRKAADIIIATYCIEHGHTLLHDDHDFAPMEEHLGLKTV